MAARKANDSPDIRNLTEVISSSAAHTVYRYRVTFPDGRTEMFFGFELEIEPS
jgi:hypothetical protein